MFARVGFDANPLVTNLACHKYSNEMLLAINRGDAKFAIETYNKAEALPALTTQQDIRGHGYTLDGPIYQGSTIETCYDLNNHPCVLKPLGSTSSDEQPPLAYRRIETFVNALAGRRFPNVVNVLSLYMHETAERKKKWYYFMPRYHGTLGNSMAQTYEAIGEIWTEVSAGLQHLHTLGFAHMDVKPDNIGISEDAHYVLIDLDGVSLFGQRPRASTEYFLPTGVISDNIIASPAVDWWMFAASIADICKCIGSVGNNVSSARQRWSYENLYTYLQNTLSERLPTVWNELSVRLIERIPRVA
jgi:serine/threonine protein kinase